MEHIDYLTDTRKVYLVSFSTSDDKAEHTQLCIGNNKEEALADFDKFAVSLRSWCGSQAHFISMKHLPQISVQNAIFN